MTSDLQKEWEQLGRTIGAHSGKSAFCDRPAATRLDYPFYDIVAEAIGKALARTGAPQHTTVFSAAKSLAELLCAPSYLQGPFQG